MNRDQLVERIAWRLFAAGVAYPPPRRAAELVVAELEAGGDDR